MSGKADTGDLSDFGSDLGVVKVAGRERGMLEHRLDGRFRPMDPQELRVIVRRLIPSIDFSGVDYILGLPEGGTLVALTLAQEVGLPLALATRMNVPSPGSVYFEEPHSVSADRDNWIHGLNPGDHVLIADDEFTTGRTLMNAVTALRAAGVIVDKVVVLVASLDAEAVERMREGGVTVHAAAELSTQMADAVLGRSG